MLVIFLFAACSAVITFAAYRGWKTGVLSGRTNTYRQKTPKTFAVELAFTIVLAVGLWCATLLSIYVRFGGAR